MKRFVCLVALAMLVSACAAPLPDRAAGTDAERDCRRHACDMYAEDSAQRRFEECMALHGAGVIPETDQHLLVGTR